MKNNILNTKQRGYTLIELMIAGVLGLILLLGVMQVYLGASQTNRLQSGVIEVQDMGRFALSYLEKDLQRAGWSNVDPGINLGTLDAHIDFTGTSNATGDNNSDAITIRYQADTELGVDTEYDCDGTAMAHSDEIVNVYTVSGGALLCNGREVLSNVVSLQILYGVESFATLTDGIVDGYLRADQIAGYEELVIAVRIAVLLRSTNNVLDENNTNSYTVLDTTYTVPASNNRQLHRLFVKTILLPNRPQAF